MAATSETITGQGTVAVASDGNAYGRPRQHSNDLLTKVGPGTPCGELMRRYWQPIASSSELRDLPRKIKILGEDLVLFRDRAGRTRRA